MTLQQRCCAGTLMVLFSPVCGVSDIGVFVSSNWDGIEIEDVAYRILDGLVVAGIASGIVAPVESGKC